MSEYAQAALYELSAYVALVAGVFAVSYLVWGVLMRRRGRR